MNTRYSICHLFNTFKKFILVMVVLIFVFNLPGYGQQASIGKISGVSGEKRLVVLEGSAYERGKMHGEKLKDEITELVKIWKSNLRDTYKIDPDKFIGDFIDQTDYLPAIKEFTPDLLEEVRGIAEGCGIDFNTMYVFQLVDEYWLNGGDLKVEHCSSLGMNRNDIDPACVGQNDYRLREGLLLQIGEQSRPPYPVTTFSAILCEGSSGA